MSPAVGRVYKIWPELVESFLIKGHGAAIRKAKQTCEDTHKQVKIWDTVEKRVIRRYEWTGGEIWAFTVDLKGEKHRDLRGKTRAQKEELRDQKSPLDGLLAPPDASVNAYAIYADVAAAPKRAILGFLANQVAGFCLGFDVLPSEFVKALSDALAELQKIPEMKSLITQAQTARKKAK